MHPAVPPTNVSASRLPRRTPVRLVDAIPNTASAVPSAESTPLIRKLPEFKQPRCPAVQALTLAIKKRYSVGRKGPPARSSPSTARLGGVKRQVTATSSLGKRPLPNNNAVPSKRLKILSERNTVMPTRKVVTTTTTSTENSKAPTVKSGARKLLARGTAQENRNDGAGSSSNNESKQKRKVQPWDLRGKLELAELKIRKLTEEVLVKENRNKVLEDLTGSAEERINSLSAQLEEEKTVSATRLNEIRLHQERIVKLEEDLRKTSAEVACKSAEIVVLNETITGLKGNIAEQQAKVLSLVAEVDRLHDLRKNLHNTIQDLKGNIRVLCRVRPPTPKEKSSASPICYIEYNDITSLELYKAKEDINAKQKKHCSFSFDRVFPASSTQEDIFDELEQLVQSCLDGYNVCVFAYGQTGSGKTFTMDGPRGDETQKGMIPRTVETIFSRVEKLKQLGWEYSVEVFFVEIYNEQIHDLLNYNSSASHEIRMVPNRKCEVFVSNLRVETVHSQEELNDLLELARNNRFVASTVCNTHSSRSHFIMRIAVNGTHRQRQLSCFGSMSLVDLAGSERYEDNNSLDRRKETMSINKSLSSLANVILALKQKNDHVPYRVSKLTHLLMPCLSGSSKTLMIVNISPLKECYSESVNSLRFANSVNQCHVVAKKNEKSTAAL